MRMDSDEERTHTLTYNHIHMYESISLYTFSGTNTRDIKAKPLKLLRDGFIFQRIKFGVVIDTYIDCKSTPCSLYLTISPFPLL